MKSIASRVYKALFALSLISMLVTIITVLLTNEHLEDVLLGSQADHIPPELLSAQHQQHIFIWDGALNKIAFIPTGATVPDELPVPFSPTLEHTKAEIELGDQTYLINIEQTDQGTLYWARNITAFEERETTLLISVTLIMVGMVVLSLLLAYWSSRKLIAPLSALSEQVAALCPGKKIQPLDLNYQDRELHHIAMTMNLFLSEMEAFIAREQQLLSLASHELRTPIAVISGALDVIERRNQQQANDRQTLLRIRRASVEMADNVDALLKLSRQDAHNIPIETINLAEAIHTIIQDTSHFYDTHQRVTVLAPSSEIHLVSNPVLVRILLRNVIHNALQHTSGPITITLEPSHIGICDQGSGLPVQSLSTSSLQKGSSGLGLYIVTLLCEKLGWTLHIQHDAHGHCVYIHYAETSPQGSKACC
ncbi:histidine kinase dimerization/phospho-acceptor domain-containing protein [Paenalcaligenes sp. Me131]|uniref:HAMP domain-containing sensor histidine kinase n=1 Tax=Paenalcaligenes sp. Me131 TaxID=3392636 RepID=UPI003D2B69BC